MVPALNLGGIPPFSGFIGKVALLQAGAQDGSVLAWILVGGSVVTSLLTLYVVTRCGPRRSGGPASTHRRGGRSDRPAEDAGDIAFADRDDVGRMPAGMLIPTFGLIAVGLALTVAAGPIFAYSERAAAEVLDRGQYITAVLGGGAP
jgi:multicomponent Na+:H+ antiporter subunit D